MHLGISITSNVVYARLYGLNSIEFSKKKC